MTPPVPPEPPFRTSAAELEKVLAVIEATAEIQTPPVGGARLQAILDKARSRLRGPP